MLGLKLNFNHIYQGRFTGTETNIWWSEGTLKNMGGGYNAWIHLKTWYCHNITKHNKTIGIFYGIYCAWHKPPNCPTSVSTYKSTSLRSFRRVFANIIHQSHILWNLEALQLVSGALLLQRETVCQVQCKIYHSNVGVQASNHCWEYTWLCDCIYAWLPHDDIRVNQHHIFVTP